MTRGNIGPLLDEDGQLKNRAIDNHGLRNSWNPDFDDQVSEPFFSVFTQCSLSETFLAIRL